MADKKKTDLFENLVMNFSIDLSEVQELLNDKEVARLYKMAYNRGVERK